MPNQIGTLQEKSLHVALKQWYKEPFDQLEMSVDNFIIDIVRNNLLIEIQTCNFSSIRKKLEKLIQNHKVRLVYPIIKDKWIIKLDSQWKKIRRRLSPKHNSYIDIFHELISIPHIVSHPNFSIEVILVQIEEIRKNDGKGSWRRNGWSIYDQKLIRIIERKKFSNPSDFQNIIPDNLSFPFTNHDLSRSLKKSIGLARKMSYCLRKMDLIKIIDKKGKAFIFDF
ncbi:MAG: hypothetical protein ACFFB0_03595 [Promethearchaeota archaeon]